jgi:hypothetical protein
MRSGRRGSNPRPQVWEADRGFLWAPVESANPHDPVTRFPWSPALSAPRRDTGVTRALLTRRPPALHGRERDAEPVGDHLRLDALGGGVGSLGPHLGRVAATTAALHLREDLRGRQTTYDSASAGSSLSGKTASCAYDASRCRCLSDANPLRASCRVSAGVVPLLAGLATTGRTPPNVAQTGNGTFGGSLRFDNARASGSAQQR